MKKKRYFILVTGIIILALLIGWLASEPFCCESAHIGKYPVNPYCTKCRGRDGVIQHECRNPNGKEIYCRTCGKIVVAREEPQITVSHDIVFIGNRQWYGEGYHNAGWFIDSSGNKRYFDLSNESHDYASIDKMYEYLNQHFDEFETEPFLESEQLIESYKYLGRIEKDANIEEKCVMVDYGAVFFYGVRLSENGNPEFVFLEEYGDWERTNTDPNADKVLEIIDETYGQPFRTPPGA